MHALTICCATRQNAHTSAAIQYVVMGVQKFNESIVLRKHTRAANTPAYTDRTSDAVRSRLRCIHGYISNDNDTMFQHGLCSAFVCDKNFHFMWLHKRASTFAHICRHNMVEKPQCVCVCVESLPVARNFLCCSYILVVHMRFLAVLSIVNCVVQKILVCLNVPATISQSY